LNYYRASEIGVFSKTNNKVTLVPPSATEKYEKKIKETLKTEIVETTICNSNLIGIFVAMNDDKIIVPSMITEYEQETLKKHFDEVKIIDSRYTAIGNLITMNNKGIAVSKFLKNEINGSSFEIAGTSLLGSTVFATDKGFLAHRNTKKEEIEKLEETLKVEGNVGTVNFGDPYVKNGLIGNKEGILVGKDTTGPEINRIDEVFILD
ncbi:MAG: translation initiation factor IF-6, partial [archaeon]